jgi:hypothetical protein
MIPSKTSIAPVLIQKVSLLKAAPFTFSDTVKTSVARALAVERGWCNGFHRVG